MATQEERLAQLERSQIANNEQFAILLGVIGEQGRDIKRTLAVVERQTELLMQHTATLEQHSEAIRELLSRLPAKD